MINVDNFLFLIMKELNVSTISELAEELGIGQPAISGWKKTGKVPNKYLLRFQHLPGVAPTSNQDFESPQPMPAEKGIIPVVGLVEAGPGVFADDSDYPMGVSDEMLSKPHGLKDENAFAVLVTGESMQPKYEPGDRVVVSPNLECRTGDHAVIGTKDGGKLIAKIRFNGDMVHLKKYNADDIKLHKKDIEFCYPVVWVKEKRF